MNFPTAVIYKQGAQKLVETIEQLRVEKEEKLKQEITNMTLDDHLLFIKSIINSYIGAELIKIHYSLPYLSAEIVDQISKVLIGHGWNVEIHKFQNQPTNNQDNEEREEEREEVQTMTIHNCDKHESMYLPEIFVNAGSNGYYQKSPDYITTTSDIKLTRPRLFHFYVRVDLNRVLVQSRYLSQSKEELEKVIAAEKFN
jgi:hypothetical protein